MLWNFVLSNAAVTMSEKTLIGKPVLKRHEVARPIHIQRLEAALDVRPFVNQVERILNSDGGSDSDDDSDNRSMAIEMSRGDKNMHGVVTSKQERQSDRLRLYNLASVGEERQWLRDVLLSSETDSSSEEDSPAAKEQRIRRLLKERHYHNKYAKDYYKDSGNSRYMYYGAGLLSTIDRYPERRISRPVPPAPVGRGRRGRPADRGAARGSQKSRRGRACAEGGDMPDGVDWEEQLKHMKEENDNDEFTIVEKPGVRGRKKLSTLKSPEALTARRKRHWQLLVKKELGKVQRARTATHRELMLQRKRLATLCCKHWRHVAMQSQKNMKETVWRCKRLSREMQAYWRRYDRAERETRRRMEREAEEQRKMDVELMEAKRQRRKLNFLITQTELYAHFMQKKLNSGEDCDSDADMILRQLDEDRDPRLAAIDNYDSEEMKARASKNALEAFQAERARTQALDASDGTDRGERRGDYDQPAIFRGTLKGYQLKGMNWLANLYDQGISGILADEMGLGKTVQCIAFLCHVAERLGVWGPFLVVSPASTLHNWQQEMQRFVPDFKVVPYWGSPSERKILRQFWERKDLHTRQAAFHVVVTSYQIVVSDLKYLNRVSWQYMILDEAQAIKSSASMRWKLLLGFSCRNRLLLSGTPIQNSMAELWALLHFIMPTLFDSHDEFNEWFSKDIESHAENKTTIDEKHLSRLHMILKPFMLRRIKKDVENELSDKIEIMVHCPLTIRQKLLYIALKKKIKIEELLHYTVGAESGHNVDKNFTSNLMNLVMQFRKVCNHPELFERRDVRSPFAMQIDDYHLPKIIAEDCILVRKIPSKRHILYNKLCVLTPEYVHRSISDGVHENSCFAFTRFMDLSPMELYRVMVCGWLCAMLHIEQTLEKYEKLRHRQQWWLSPHNSDVKQEIDIDMCESETDYDRVNSKHLLLVCPDGDVLRKRKHDCLLWKELLFTDPLWIEGGPFYIHTEHILHYMPETVEHRALRTRNLKTIDGQTEMLSEIKTEEGGVIAVEPQPVETPEFPHVERAPRVYRDVPTPLPAFLCTAQQKVQSFALVPFAVSRSFAHSIVRHQHGENAEGAHTLARLVAAARPPQGWASLQVPDKNQLVSDAGKLTVLDSLLKRLKERGHRVLIYSQMTKMIDLLEEYMWHRKHKYMRLDGSSKISARRDMVADFQARADIFVFLLSTRAGGLGINLTAADTVIFYDSDWNPTVDQQAMDRAHRLGQTKQVTVYRLICKGTIEERIMQRAREKSEIQRMVISGGNFKPDTLKPKEVVSLLLDDEEIELKYRQKSEEKKIMEERERKRKLGILPSAAAIEPKRARESASEPGSPLQVDDDSDQLHIDSSPQPHLPYSPPVRSSWANSRSARGARRGRPRGSRHAMGRRPDAPSTDQPPASASAAAVAARAGAALLDSDGPLEPLETSSGMEGRGRRGPGRPRLRAPVRAARPSRRARRPREPLLVPLAPPP
ncbi:chromatin-remodeling ATPase INO80 isoform X2 [Maniola jurtina]|uniref:chromatin-remodeling ATPase INO80 isoform X2 n=1 Tax=Maniola jurtina TaxID=191418 RepID=UPI001E68A90A|nr:chromatin-remodeling ATPase INO80 isoform X2 [Maniola jurtina]